MLYIAHPVSTLSLTSGLPAIHFDIDIPDYGLLGAYLTYSTLDVEKQVPSSPPTSMYIDDALRDICGVIDSNIYGCTMALFADFDPRCEDNVAASPCDELVDVFGQVRKAPQKEI